MLIICNGIYKSGSTWVYMLVSEIKGSNPIPLHLATSHNSKEFELTKVIKNGYHHNNDVVAKAHCYDIKFLEILNQNNAIFIFSDRSIGEVLKSHYHHFSNDKIRLPFFIYILSIGVFKSIEISFFKRTIIDSGYNNITIEYNDLNNNIYLVIKKISILIGVSLTDMQIQEVIDKTRMTEKHNVQSQTGMKNREWFFSRPDVKLSFINIKLLTIVSFLPSLILRSNIPRNIIGYLLLLIPSRNLHSQYTKLK